MCTESYLHNFELLTTFQPPEDKNRVCTDLEKSWKMTLGLENSWNSKKVQFVLELSWNFEKNPHDNHKKSLKMIETGFYRCSAQQKSREL